METDMRAAVDFLYDLPKFTTKNSLDHTRKLLELLGDPCLDRKVIHVAGSNGKGSVCCFLYHILLAAGKSAGMFTSPHLIDIRERFQMDGGMVSGEDFLLAFNCVKSASEELVRNNLNHPTFFEFIFAMAMVIFEKAQTEYIILETGLGGRLDATNSYPHPILSVITSVSLEHTEILGDTLAQIAAEKAGILKPGVPVVYPDGEPEAAEVIRSRAEALGCPFRAVVPAVRSEKIYNYEIKENSIDFSCTTAYDRANDEEKSQISLLPAHPEQDISGLEDHAPNQSTHPEQCGMPDSSGRVWHISGHALWQAENAALAVESMRLLHLMPDEFIQQGLSAAIWPGRMQEVQPEIWCDGAHNPSGIAAFAQTVQRLAGTDSDPPLLVFSMVREKDIRTAVSLLTEGIFWGAIAVAAVPGERGVPAETLAQLFREAAVSPAENTGGAAAPGRFDSADPDVSRTSCPVEAFASPGAALSAMRVRKKHGQKLFCTGSLYFIGELLKLL